ncbi:DUF4320 family protein [Bacillus cereus group sp. MYBK249-1]|uniref:DUF4320 family protein n=5 Tax=Bacillus cereus group TaxID=86661 RepID=A0A5B9I3E1_BACCE|nr:MULTISPECIES: DUF4320 family protein [Bacillus cereus group]MRB05845.1 DUF4320 family protein [Bacillus thuringiensis]AHX21683.1 hypothetical protein CY96_28115 [Bacillus bombysepticus str. Wang]MDA2074188.1 DUF4320 family protein [Bacillus cereus]MEB9431311.1 DUF4320 family protein [Bacillus cereus]MEB9480944.1 DUF4320 family protein [Bacillus cereus]
MQNTVTTALFLTLSLLLISLLPEGVLYGIQLVKAHNFASDMVEIAENKGGFQYDYNGKRVDLVPGIEKRMKEEKMDGWKYEYTKGRIDHSQPLSFKVKSEHHFFIFKLIGVDGIKAPIWASKDGLGQVYFK